MPRSDRLWRLVSFVCVVVGAGLAGCHSKPQPVPRENVVARPGLGAIVLRYERVVEEMTQSETETWHHDWTGNIIPNTLGGRHRGLCYEWQERVWAGVAQTVWRAGWRGVGLAANRDHWTEHHVVVVFDPARTTAHELLATPTAAGDIDGWTPKPGKSAVGAVGAAWILDPWHTGTPMVYTMDEWLTRGTAEWFTVELEGLGGASVETLVGPDARTTGPGLGVR